MNVGRKDEGEELERELFSQAGEPASRLGSLAACGNSFSLRPHPKNQTAREGEEKEKTGIEAEVHTWRHPCNPDFTPQHFWNILEDFRHPLEWKDDDTVLPASLPQIVPKINLSLIPNAAQPGLVQPSQSKDREERNVHMPVLRKTGRDWLRSNHSRALAGPGSFPSPKNDMPESQSNWFTSLQRPQHSSSFVATDKELMNFQHRKMGIKPFGVEWDLRGSLQAQDRTLQVAQVAAAVIANQNLEVRPCPCLSSLTRGFTDAAFGTV